jgi:multiple sugar transport system substrate-binding protein
MRARFVAIAAMAVLVFGACSGGGGGGAGGGAATGGQAFDANAVTGDLTLQGWSAGAVEAPILDKLLVQFQQKYPKIKVKFQPLAGDYPAAMLAKFSAKTPADLFYVDSGVAQDWIDQGLLEPLDDLAKNRGFDTSQFYEGYLNAFKGEDGKVYGFPKDGNTLGMAVNPDVLQKAGVSGPPTTWAELTSAVEKLKASGVTPMCLSASLDRALMFIYQNGGAVLTDDKKASAIDKPESKEAIQTYLDWFANGYGKAPKDLGDDWCGKSLGAGKVGIIFEGGWLDPYMKEKYPATKYQWAEVPQGKQKATLAFTVSYSIGADSKNKDASWVLLSYLTGPEGMKTWTEGGIANPSRKDVPAAAGKEILVKGAEYAKPWSFIPGFGKINDAFNNALTAAIEKKGTSDDVVAKTKAEIDKAVQ